jgi:hypothetical protein
MRTRRFAVVCGLVAFAGCGAEGEVPSDSNTGDTPASAGSEQGVREIKSAATNCLGYTAPLSSQVGAGRATKQVTTFFIFQLTYFYAAGNSQELLGTDPNQVVTTYPRVGGGYTASTANCLPELVCGDGALNTTTELCDGSDLGGHTCANDGFAGGTLRCDGSCAFDYSACTSACGDGKKSVAEDCDGTVPDADSSCQGHYPEEYVSGKLKCGSDCKYDVSGCQADVCGNGKREIYEHCDGADLDGFKTCDAYNPVAFFGGTLKCGGTCDFDTSACAVRCGNGKIDAGETCDGTATDATHSSKKCSDYQFYLGTWPFGIKINYGSGTVVCNGDCQVDTSACKPAPGCYLQPVLGGSVLRCF